MVKEKMYNFDNIIFHIRLLFLEGGGSSGALMHGWNLDAKNHIVPRSFGGREGRSPRACIALRRRGPLGCFTGRLCIGSNFMSVLLTCGCHAAGLPVEPRGAHVIYFCSQ